MPDMPPNFSLTLIAIGVVTERGIREFVSVLSKPHNLHNPMVLPIETMQLVRQPTKIGSQYFFNTLSCK